MRKYFLAAFLVSAAILSQAQARRDPTTYIRGPNEQGSCCTNYTQRPLPLKILASYERGSDRCSLPAVIFETKNGMRVCADPTAPWTQQRIRVLDGNVP